MEGNNDVTPQQADRLLSGAWDENNSQVDECELCSRLEPLFWHCTSQGIVDRARCRRTHGDGLWLCALCEEGVHRWMQQHPSKEAGRKAVDAMVQRLAATLFAKPRKYRKTPKESDDEQ